ALEELDGAPRPDAPMAEQAAGDPELDRRAVAREAERGQEIEHDAVVIAGIERDALLGARLDDAAHHVEGAVAVEGRDLHRDHRLELGKAPPEAMREREAAHGGLEIESDERHHLAHGAAMGDELVLARALQ